MDLLDVNGISFQNLANINVMLGKNGCGKSYLLKRMENSLPQKVGIGKVRYISPERGGLLRYEPSVESNIIQDPNWLPNTRRRNISDTFRMQSAALFRRFETRFHRKDQADGVLRPFANEIAKLNVLLDRVRFELHDERSFQLVDKATGAWADPETISSGESELVSLGIEFLAFCSECVADKNNVFLVDEPDVHLHPDLQDRFTKFIVDSCQGLPVTVIIATHSTSILAGLASRVVTHVAFMQPNAINLTFKSVTAIDKQILPVFGAHPLSNVFNQSPILLLEGEDDDRVWQQAVRSSQGRIKVFPVDVKGNANLAEYETESNSLIGAVYDQAAGYSLRDRDEGPEFINDLEHILRMRLSCRAAENLMLSNEALALAGTDWAAVQQLVQQWAATQVQHQYHAFVQAFIAGGFDRKGHDLKEIRNILIGLFSNKPWEVLVGQAIAGLQANAPNGDGSLRDYLGARVWQHILKYQ